MSEWQNEGERDFPDSVNMLIHALEEDGLVEKVNNKWQEVSFRLPSASK